MNHSIYMYAALGALAVYGLMVLFPAVIFCFTRPYHPSGKNIPVTVIIAARNEERTIGDCIDAVCLQQEMDPRYEVIAVDDHSEDNTYRIASERMKVHPNLRVLVLEEGCTGKKAALSKGVAEASNEIILITDADSFAGPLWQRTMSSAFANGEVKFVTGPVIYDESNPFHVLQSELMAIQVINGGLARIGSPLLASGANMGFRKSFFNAIGGFKKDRYTSGDDLYLMEQAKSTDPSSVFYVHSRAAIISTKAVRGPGPIISQRARWLSKTGGMGGPLMKIYGSVIALINLLMPLVIASVIHEKGGEPMLNTFLAGKISVDVLLLSLAFPFFRRTPVFFTLVIAELLYPFIMLTAALSALCGRLKWKGRTIGRTR